MPLTVLSHQRRMLVWHRPPHPFAWYRPPCEGVAIVSRVPVAGATLVLVTNHVVQGRIIFPATGYLETVPTTAGTALRSVFFVQPLAVMEATLLIECTVAEGGFEVRSHVGGGAVVNATMHCTGALAADDGERHVELTSVRARSCARGASVDALYDGFDTVWLQYGPGYRTLLQAWSSTREALARLQSRSTHEGTRVHPADLDDALCAGALFASSGGGGTRLPFAVDEAQLQSAPGVPWAVRRTWPAASG